MQQLEDVDGGNVLGCGPCNDGGMWGDPDKSRRKEPAPSRVNGESRDTFGCTPGTTRAHDDSTKNASVRSTGWDSAGFHPRPKTIRYCPHRATMDRTAVRCTGQPLHVSDSGKGQGDTKDRPVHLVPSTQQHRCDGNPATSGNTQAARSKPVFAEVSHRKQAPAEAIVSGPGGQVCAPGRPSTDGSTRPWPDHSAVVLKARNSAHAFPLPETRQDLNGASPGTSPGHPGGGTQILTPKMIMSHWPYKKQSKATQEEMKLPLMMKDVTHTPIQIFREYIMAHAACPIPTLTAFDSYAHVFVQPPEPPPACTQRPPLLTSDDMQRLLQAQLIAECTETPKGWVNCFSVAELAKNRRRWIVHPAWLNDMEPNPPTYPITTRLFKSVKWGYGLVADIKAYFHHFRLPESSQKYFCFRWEGKIYSITTIPTGARHCPGMAQVFAEVLARQLEREFEGKIQVEVYLDNFRILCNDLALGHLALRRLRSMAPFVAWNDDASDPQQYEFLGVWYNHLRKTVSLGPKTKGKLTSIELFFTNHSRVDGQPTCAATSQLCRLEDILSIFGVLMYASSIVSIDMSQFYTVLKFMRRRCGQHLKSRANVWDCTLHSWRTWTRLLIEAGPRHIDSSPAPRDILYTDASNVGWGAVLFRKDNSTAILAGPWWGTARDLHINAKEMLAAILALDRIFAHDNQPSRNLVVYIDNTTAKRIFEKTYSRSFQLNSMAAAMYKLCQKWHLQLTFEFVASDDNLADYWSRIWEKHAS